MYSCTFGVGVEGGATYRCHRSSSHGKLIFTGLPAFNTPSVLNVIYTVQGTRDKRCEFKLTVLPVLRTNDAVQVQGSLTDATRWHSFGLISHAIARQFKVPVCSQQALCQEYRLTAEKMSKSSTKVFVHTVSDLLKSLSTFSNHYKTLFRENMKRIRFLTS